MRALVVFESMFGNTQAVAVAVAEGLAAHAEVVMSEVSDAPTVVPDDVDLLVVGAPTHALTLSRPATRQDARERTGRTPVSSGTGLREWADEMAAGPHTVAATFDTRVRRPRLPGSAARAAFRRLRRRGVTLVSPAQSFYVDGMAGPLADGERERARRWADDLGARVADGVAARRGAGREGRRHVAGRA